MSNNNCCWDIIIKLRGIGYKNPTNIICDISEQLEGCDFIEDIELICAEKLPIKKNGEGEYVPVKMYDDLTVDNWNIKEYGRE